jgi:hypothetical protein
MALVGNFTASDSIGQASTIATPAEHATRLAAATYTGLDRTNTQSDTKVLTVDTAANSTDDGEQTWNTTSLIGSNGPSRRLQIQDSTAGVALEFVECLYSASTPASGYNIPGVMWRDMTLHLWRRYESATTAPNGVAGWHPVDSAYALWKNESGGTVAATKVVIHKAAGTAELRAFTTSTIGKDQAVVGVTLESITDGAYGVIALASGSAEVTILADDGEANGAIAKGDFLASFTVAGECRTVGPQTASGIVAAGNHTLGTPMGAFAVALGVKDAGTHLVRAKMLGFVGAGAMAFLKRVKIVSDTAPETANAELFASKIASGTSGAQGTETAAISTKHLPFCAARMDVSVVATMAAGGSVIEVGFYADGGTVVETVVGFVMQGNGDTIGGFVSTGFIPTHGAGATTTKGSVFSYIYAPTNIASVGTFEMYLTGYIY